MLTTITILLIRQYRRSESPAEFFKWLLQKISGHSCRVIGIGLTVVFIAAILKS